jgi:hypothetical protein
LREKSAVWQLKKEKKNVHRSVIAEKSKVQAAAGAIEGKANQEK